eukprot:scaffold2393_cov267-Pinguiococcus_pyrenoidosus.AAC.26
MCSVRICLYLTDRGEGCKVTMPSRVDGKWALGKKKEATQSGARTRRIELLFSIRGARLPVRSGGKWEPMGCPNSEILQWRGCKIF